MKKLIVVFILSLVVVSISPAQRALSLQSDAYIPRTFTLGALMSARTDTAAYDDTTQMFLTRGLAACYVGIETSTNDSADILISYRSSKDGVNANGGGFVVLDSLNTSGSANIIKYYALPAAALGAVACQVRVYQQTTFPKYSINPSTKVTTKIIRIPIYKQ